MSVAIGSDHAGLELKETLKAFLAGKHEEVLDVGTYTREAVDYADYAVAVGAALREHRADRGIILCGSGVGASMAANRISGIRAGLCHDTYSAHQGVEHDNMNVLVIGGRVVGSELAREVVGAFLNAQFRGEPRHVRRLAKMTALESPVRALDVFGQSVWYDNIRRGLITSGELQRLIEEDGAARRHLQPRHLREGHRRQHRLRPGPQAPGRRASTTPTDALRDARHPGHPARRRLLYPVYIETDRRDGYVSLEVSPLPGRTTRQATIEEARRLWAARRPRQRDDQGAGHARRHPRHPPADQRGHQRQRHAAVRQRAYEQVADAYMAGLEALSRKGGDAAGSPAWPASSSAASIRSIDARLEQLLDAGRAREQRQLKGAASARSPSPTPGSPIQRYQRPVQRPDAGRRWPRGGPAAAAAVGQHGHEEPEVSRRRSTSMS